jgi:GMP reductase
MEWTGFPLIASNMDAIGTFRMARALASINAMVALHKHYPAEELVDFFEKNTAQNTFCTTGITDGDV